MPPRDFTFWAKIPVGVKFQCRKVESAEKMANFGDYPGDLIFPLLPGILGGCSREPQLHDHAVQKVLSSADVPPEKLLDLPGLPRCKNL